MGLFSRNFERPGPGVPKDMPRKTGTARFFELLLRDFVDYIKLSLLFSLIVLPSAAVFIFSVLPLIASLVLGEAELWIDIRFLLLSLPLAFPVGGGLVACYFNITRFMRDDPSFLWHDFKRKFKENYKQAALSGIVCTAFVYMQILLWLLVYFQAVNNIFSSDLVWFILAVMSLILFTMITPYIFLHYAYIDLKTSKIIRNSLLMTFAHLPRSFMGALCGGIIWVLFALFMPESLNILPMVPLILVSLSMLLQLSWIWPKFDGYFGIEEALIKKRKEREASAEEEKGEL